MTVSENFAKANSGLLIVSKVAKKLSYLILNATVTKNNGHSVTQDMYCYGSAMAS